MAARMDTRCTDDDHAFPVRYQKAKNERGYKSARTASLESSQVVTGQLYEQSVLVYTNSCSSAGVPHKGECYGRGIIDEGISKITDQVNEEAVPLQGNLKVEVEEVKGTSIDVNKLNEQVQYLKSCVHLCLEEAFYLVHCKRCLKVYVDDADTILTAEDLWKQCVKRDKNFVHKYVVYQYYRNKGWVPKPGTKFGVHFLLYKDGPAYYHSSYGVIVKSVMSASELTWQSVISLVRTMESVNKGAILCEVKSDMTFTDFSTPFCISNFIVEETLIHRWVPKQDRN